MLSIAAVLLAAASPAPATAAATKRVTLRDFEFSPKTARIHRGDTVAFRWADDGIAHDVRSRGSKRFRSISARDSGTVRRTFKRTGTFRYVCTLHPGMAGKVVVSSR